MTVFHSLHRQAGVALVTAMLLMVIGVLLSARLAWDAQIHLRRATTVADLEQARLFAMGAESIAIAALKQDLEDYPNETMIPTHAMEADHLLVWQEFPVGVDDVNLGVMNGKLSDLQGRLNLNNLVELIDDEFVRNKTVSDQFEALFDNLQLDANLVDAIIDWIDPDTVAETFGAEDDFYTGMKPPYRAANRDFIDVSELRAVAGFDEEIYKEIAPFVTALPRDACRTSPTGVTKVNVNFAQPELLAALHDDIDIATAQTWYDTAQLSGIDALSNINLPVNTPLLEGTDPDNAYISTVTHCFSLTVHVAIGTSVLSMYSVIERPGQSGPSAQAGDEVVVRQRVFGIENPD